MISLFLKDIVIACCRSKILLIVPMKVQVQQVSILTVKSQHLYIQVHDIQTLHLVVRRLVFSCSSKK